MADIFGYLNSFNSSLQEK